MSKFDERIIVVPRNILFDEENNQFNGFLANDSKKGKKYSIHLVNTKLNVEVIWKKILTTNN